MNHAIFKRLLHTYLFDLLSALNTKMRIECSFYRGIPAIKNVLRQINIIFFAIRFYHHLFFRDYKLIHIIKLSGDTKRKACYRYRQKCGEDEVSFLLSSFRTKSLQWLHGNCPNNTLIERQILPIWENR